MTTVDCTGIDKVLLLQELWRNSIIAAFFTLNLVPAPLEPAYSEFEEAANGYIDYLAGRVIKTNFGNFPELNSEG